MFKRDLFLLNFVFHFVPYVVVLIFVHHLNMFSGFFQKDGDFIWDKTIQGQILGAFFWPYAICQIPSGILITKMGARKLFGFCMILASITTVLVPVLSQYSSWYVIILRAAQGIFQVNIQSTGPRRCSRDIYHILIYNNLSLFLSQRYCILI